MICPGRPELTPNPSQWNMPDELVQLQKKLDVDAARARGEHVEAGE